MIRAAFLLLIFSCVVFATDPVEHAESESAEPREPGRLSEFSDLVDKSRTLVLAKWLYFPSLLEEAEWFTPEDNDFPWETLLIELEHSDHALNTTAVCEYLGTFCQDQKGWQKVYEILWNRAYHGPAISDWKAKYEASVQPQDFTVIMVNITETKADSLQFQVSSRKGLNVRGLKTGINSILPRGNLTEWHGFSSNGADLSDDQTLDEICTSTPCSIFLTNTEANPAPLVTDASKLSRVSLVMDPFVELHNEKYVPDEFVLAGLSTEGEEGGLDTKLYQLRLDLAQVDPHTIEDVDFNDDELDDHQHEHDEL